MQGTIKKILDQRGYGFISTDEQEKDLFFHRSQVSGIAFEDLREGQAVTFEMEDSPRGPQAVKVAKA